jgi:hypothetical protein
MKTFFGQDKVLVKNALKAVLPESVSDETLSNAAEALYTYKDKDKDKDKENKRNYTNVDLFFREMYDK